MTLKRTAVLAVFPALVATSALAGNLQSWGFGAADAGTPFGLIEDTSVDNDDGNGPLFLELQTDLGKGEVEVWFHGADGSSCKGVSRKGAAKVKKDGRARVKLERDAFEACFDLGVQVGCDPANGTLGHAHPPILSGGPPVVVATDPALTAADIEALPFGFSWAGSVVLDAPDGLHLFTVVGAGAAEVGVFDELGPRELNNAAFYSAADACGLIKADLVVDGLSPAALEHVPGGTSPADLGAVPDVLFGPGSSDAAGVLGNTMAWG